MMKEIVRVVLSGDDLGQSGDLGGSVKWSAALLASAMARSFSPMAKKSSTMRTASSRCERGGTGAGRLRSAIVRRPSRARELAIVGRCPFRRFLVEGFGPQIGIVGLGDFGRAALPIGNPCDRDRRLRKTGRDGEMMRGPLRIVEETQGDPAGMEFGVDAGFVQFRRLFVADFISGRRIAGIEQLAGQKPPLDPPSIAVDQHGGVARRGEHERGRLNDLVLMPQFMDSGVEESRIVPQVRRHGVEHRVGCRIVVRGSEQARQDDFVRPREHGIAQAARIVFLIEQAVRARLIIRRAEIGAEFAAHMRFERRHQIGMAPDIAHQRLRFGVLALLAQGARPPPVCRAQSAGWRVAKKLSIRTGSEWFW